MNTAFEQYINEWKSLLEEVDSSENSSLAIDSQIDSKIDNLIQIGQKMGGNSAKIANMAKKLSESMNEANGEKNGLVKPIVYAILGLSLAMNAIGGGLYAMNLKGKKDANAREFATIMQDNKVNAEAKSLCEKAHDLLNSIEDSVVAFDSSLEPTFDDILDATNQEIEQAKTNAEFEKIMAEP